MAQRRDTGRRLRRSTIVLAAVFAAGLVGAPGGMTEPTLAAAERELPVPADEAGSDVALETGPRAAVEQVDVVGAGDRALQQVAAFDDATWDIAALAASLASDPEAAFGFVRDRIAFDPYPGILRGPSGTLAARAGNAWDRALLLRAILDAQGHTTRLASAVLDAGAVDAVVDRAMEDPPEPLDDPTAADVIGFDVNALEVRARRDHAWLRTALADVPIGGGPPSAAVGVGDHAWVQLAAADGSWIDLDPTLLSARIGSTLAPAAATQDEPPPDRAQSVRITLVAETLADGTLSETAVLEETLEARAAAASELWLTFHPQGAAPDRKLADVLGEVTWLPVLSVGSEDVAGTPFEAGGGGDVGDFFGGGGADLTGLRLELRTEAPGSDPVVSERILLDRIPPDLRESGPLVAELLEPLPTGGVPLAMAGMHQLLVSTGGFDLRDHAVGRALAIDHGASLVSDPAADGYGLVDLLFPLAIANRDLVAASERIVVAGLDAAGPERAYVGRPRIWVVSFEPLPGTPDGTSLTTDLVLDDIEVLSPDADPVAVADHRLWYGVLQTALETELSLERSRAVDPAGAVVGSVSLAMTGPPSVRLPGDDGAAPAGGPALAAALARGDIALIVGDPSTSSSFWAIDPASGRAASVAEPGVRIGWVGGGNAVDAVGWDGPRHVIDPDSAGRWGTIRDGKFTPHDRPPPSRCQGGTEYVIILGCVSLPASITAGMASNIVVTAAVSWAIVLLELIFLT